MRTGRPPEAGKSRAQSLCVRFTEDEASALDLARGGTSRSAFVRQAVKDAVQRKSRS